MTSWLLLRQKIEGSKLNIPYRDRKISICSEKAIAKDVDQTRNGRGRHTERDIIEMT